jgi:hypothetical protein
VKVERIVMHVGMGKSGSTAIQRYCRTHAAALAAQGVCYGGLFFEGINAMKADPQPDLGTFLQMSLEQQQQFTRDVVKALRNSPQFAEVRTLFVSNEGLFDYFRKLRPLFNHLGRALPVTLLVFMRNPEDWLWSAYLQWGIKHKTNPGRVQDVDEWVRDNIGRFNYGMRLRTLLKMYPDLEVKAISYDDCPDVVARCLEEVGATPPAPTSERVYTTPTLTAHALVKLVNNQVEGTALPGHIGDILKRAAILEKPYHRTNLEIPRPSPAILEEVRGICFAEHDGLPKLLDPVANPKFYAPRGEAPAETQADTSTVIAALVDLVLFLEGRLARLERKVAEKT